MFECQVLQSSFDCSKEFRDTSHCRGFALKSMRCTSPGVGKFTITTISSRGSRRLSRVESQITRVLRPARARLVTQVVQSLELPPGTLSRILRTYPTIVFQEISLTAGLSTVPVSVKLRKCLLATLLDIGPRRAETLASRPGKAR